MFFFRLAYGDKISPIFYEKQNKIAPFQDLERDPTLWIQRYNLNRYT